jgi:hypothetical protein
MALLLPDPCDEHCPVDFKGEARELLLKTRGNIEVDDIGLRRALLKFIGDFANWDLSSDTTYLEVGRGLVKAAHPEETPLVVDPFAGVDSPMLLTSRWRRTAVQRRSTASTRPCSSRHPAAPTPCGRCSSPKSTAAPTSSAWPTRCPRCIPRAATRNDLSTPCCWRFQGENTMKEMTLARRKENP